MAALREGLEEYDRRHGWRGPITNIKNSEWFISLQAPCQVELETWVNSIHSACAAAFARHRGKTGTLHLLQEEIYRLEKGIESVSW